MTSRTMEETFTGSRMSSRNRLKFDGDDDYESPDFASFARVEPSRSRRRIDGMARQKQLANDNTRHSSHQKQNKGNSTSAIGLKLLAIFSISALCILITCLVIVGAKTHHSKRQAPLVLALQQQQQAANSENQQKPRSHFESGNNNWWNLWWQQYINDAIQPEVAPIEAVRFAGKTIALAPEEPDDEMRDDGFAPRAAGSPGSPGPTTNQNMNQRNRVELERNVRFLEPENQPQAQQQQPQQRLMKTSRNQQQDDQGQFGIQMRASMQQRNRSPDQQLQQAIDEISKFDQSSQQQHQQLVDYSEEPDLGVEFMEQQANKSQQQATSNSQGGQETTPSNFTDSSSSNMMMPERPAETSREKTVQTMQNSDDARMPVISNDQPQMKPNQNLTSQTEPSAAAENMDPQPSRSNSNVQASTATPPSLETSNNNKLQQQQQPATMFQGARMTAQQPAATGFGMRTGTSPSNNPSSPSQVDQIEREQQTNARPVPVDQNANPAPTPGLQSSTTQPQSSTTVSGGSRVELINGRPSANSGGRNSQVQQQQQQGTTTSSRLPTKSGQARGSTVPLSTTPMPVVISGSSARPATNFQSTSVRQPPMQQATQTKPAPATTSKPTSSPTSTSTTTTPASNNAEVETVTSSSPNDAGSRNTQLGNLTSPGDSSPRPVANEPASERERESQPEPTPPKQVPQGDRVPAASPGTNNNTNKTTEVEPTTPANSGETEIDSETDGNSNSNSESDEDKEDAENSGSNEDDSDSGGSPEVEVEGGAGGSSSDNTGETVIESTTTTESTPRGATGTTTTLAPMTTPPTVLTTLELQRIPSGSNQTKSTETPATTKQSSDTSQADNQAGRIPMVMINLASEKQQDASDAPITMSMDALMRMVMMTNDGDSSSIVPQTTPKPLPTSQPDSAANPSTTTAGIKTDQNPPASNNNDNQMASGPNSEPSSEEKQQKSVTTTMPPPPPIDKSEAKQTSEAGASTQTMLPNQSPTSIRRRPQSQPPPTTPMPPQPVSQPTNTPAETMTSYAQKAVTMVLETLQREGEPIKVMLSGDNPKVELLDMDMIPIQPSGSMNMFNGNQQQQQQQQPILVQVRPTDTPTTPAGNQSQQKQQQQESSITMMPQPGISMRIPRINEQNNQQIQRAQNPMQAQTNKNRAQENRAQPTTFDVVAPGMRLKPLQTTQATTPQMQQQMRNQINSTVMQPILSNDQVYMIMMPTGSPTPALIMTGAHTKRPQPSQTTISQQQTMSSRPPAPAIMLMNSNANNQQTTINSQPMTEMTTINQRQQTNFGSTKSPPQRTTGSMGPRSNAMQTSVSPMSIMGMRMQQQQQAKDSTRSQQQVATTKQAPLGLITRMQTTNLPTTMTSGPSSQPTTSGQQFRSTTQTMAPPATTTNPLMMEFEKVAKNANNMDEIVNLNGAQMMRTTTKGVESTPASNGSGMTQQQQPSRQQGQQSASGRLILMDGPQQATTQRAGGSKASAPTAATTTTTQQVTTGQTQTTAVPSKVTPSRDSISGSTRANWNQSSGGPSATTVMDNGGSMSTATSTSQTMRMTQRELAMMRSGKPISGLGDDTAQATGTTKTMSSATAAPLPPTPADTMPPQKQAKTTKSSPTSSSSSMDDNMTTPAVELINNTAATSASQSGKLQEMPLTTIATTTTSPSSSPTSTQAPTTTTTTTATPTAINSKTADQSTVTTKDNQNVSRPVSPVDAQSASSPSPTTTTTTTASAVTNKNQQEQASSTPVGGQGSTTPSDTRPAGNQQQQQSSSSNGGANKKSRVIPLGTKGLSKIGNANGTSNHDFAGPKSPSNQLRGATKSAHSMIQVQGPAGNRNNSASQTAAALRQFGGGNRMSALANQPVPFGRPSSNLVAINSQGQGGGRPRYEAPTYEYGPSIAVRRPDEPLASGQIPNCTLTGRNFCVLTNDYPMNAVRQAVERSFRSVRIMYEELQTVSDQELHRDDFANATSSQAAMGRFACQTSVEMMRPGWAKDEITKEWMLVVNTDVFPQRVRTESCAQPNTPCEFIAPFYDSTCQQRYSLHRMIAIDPHDPSRSPQVAVFKFPAGCVCRVHPIKKSTPNPLSSISPISQTQATTSVQPQMQTTTPKTNTI